MAGAAAMRAGAAAVAVVACAAAIPTARFALRARDEREAAPAVARVPAAVARGVALAVHARGLSQPVALAAAPGDAAGRLWVAEKTGRLRVLDAGGAVIATPLDLSAEVSQKSEQGLLGLAFHPGFAENRRLFVNYTAHDRGTRVVEYRAAAAGDGPAERVREVLRVAQPWSNHNGGNLAFGPDGRLWVGLGDGGSGGDPQGNGQAPGARLGKMLRVDVDADPPRVEIALRGVRNPWRYSFDRRTGDLYVGDVGQNRFEEVDVLAAGTTSGNLGWNVREGFACFAPETGCASEGLTAPVLVYPTGKDGCTVVGGYVYRGSALPALDGVYFYADHCTALIRSFRWKGAGAIADHWDWKAALDPDDRLAQIASFGEDAAGELYLLSLDGTIRKLVPAAPAE